jgi:hypothetical protein
MFGFPRFISSWQIASFEGAVANTSSGRGRGDVNTVQKVFFTVHERLLARS